MCSSVAVKKEKNNAILIGLFESSKKLDLTGSKVDVNSSAHLDGYKRFSDM